MEISPKKNLMVKQWLSVEQVHRNREAVLQVQLHAGTISSMEGEAVLT
jgi:hypothetical protein